MDLELTQEKLMSLQRCSEHKDFDDLLNPSTPSTPAIWSRESRSFVRIHLDEHDERLPACKQTMKALKEQIKQQLIAECGEDGYAARMPFDFPIVQEEVAHKTVA